MNEQDNRPGSVDSDILQGKADVLRAVRTAAEQGNGGRGADKTDHTPDNGKKHAIQVEVKPVVAIRSDRAPQGGRPQKDNAAEGPEPPAPAAHTEAAAPAATAKSSAHDAPSGSQVQEGTKEHEAVREAVEPAPCAAKPQESASSGGEEPKPAAGDKVVAVPRFNLGDQILAEQRRTASERRQKSAPSERTAQTYPAQDTVGEVIREARNNRGPAGSPRAADEDAKAARHGIALNDDNINDIQGNIVADIVAREIAAFSGRAAARRTWPRPATN